MPGTDFNKKGVGVLDNLQFNTTLVNPPHSRGLMFYDISKNALSYYNEDLEVTINLGQELVFPVVNNSGATINNGDVVTPDSTGIVLADRHYKDKSRLIAVATSTMLDGESGYVTRLGQVGGLNTLGYTSGQILYLGNLGQWAIAPPDDGSYTVIVGVVDVVDELEGIITVDINVSDLTVEVTDTNGYPPTEKANILMSKVDATRTFTLAPITGTHYHLYELGFKYQIEGSDSAVWDDLEGEHWVYYQGGVLTITHEPTLAQKIAVILNYAFTATLYWNATDKKVEIDILEERHGIGMSPSSHIYNHLTRGAQYYGDGLLTGDIIADATGDLDTHAQFSVSAGSYFDEDITHIRPAHNVGDTMLVVYNSGVNLDVRTGSQAGFAVLNAPAGRLYYNQNLGGVWGLAEVPNNDFVNYHVITINGVTVSHVAVMGQATYGTKAEARDGANLEIASILSKLPFAELIATNTVIYQTSDGYANAVKARIISTETGDSHINWLATEISKGVPAASHLNLTNLQLAGPGVTWGHVDDQIQVIDGAKTFLDPATFTDSIFNTVIKSGATQVAAGAAANEFWKTSGHATLPDNVILIGV